MNGSVIIDTLIPFILEKVPGGSNRLAGLTITSIAGLGESPSGYCFFWAMVFVGTADPDQRSLKPSWSFFTSILVDNG
jgi:hypothetical protein